MKNHTKETQNSTDFTTRVLGINFYTGTEKELMQHLVQKRGLILVPSGPGLATLDSDPDYRKALIRADIVIVDSGYLALLWKLRTSCSLPRISGLRLMHALLNNPNFRKSGNSAWVMPSEGESNSNCAYAQQRGIEIPESHVYVAPVYPSFGPVIDKELLCRLEKHKPQFVVLTVAGGKQEKLGLYLRDNLSYKPSILCTGAAIAFLTGNQTRIPMWADRLYMGWLYRCIDKPTIYVPRYWGAIRLIWLVFKYGKKQPFSSKEGTLHDSH